MIPINVIAKIILLIATIVSVVFPSPLAAKILVIIFSFFTCYVAVFRNC